MAVAALVISLVSLAVAALAVLYVRRQARATEELVHIEKQRDRDSGDRRKDRRLAQSMGPFYEQRHRD
jgi:hypothetical protein